MIVQVAPTTPTETHDAGGTFFVDGTVFGTEVARKDGKVAVTVDVGAGRITLMVPEHTVKRVDS